ncbi:Pre-mRNA-splicing factor SLU7 [Galdieria sulphuraria]|uniref:Pre-mRNA-splicing factor SLU7 n=1 Tax=Galdieria sulphuraria TaxID=130081 RepID=M2XRF0_GALSU|nr:pre-mRNA-processing factor SLU7 [Galdieria sulphuraria]EME32812.1 pre-mRNA-processing factor SLU7 [Galdieria sulphuraria]GJD12640.1 Pre-mRNA-splicing factor SLU7 [Galdieria sulphuraria]|eukprot:XP_005709332.1 pre-mRNA-processing factor SLU7 [Galdieria sulphuraria]
MASSSHMFKSRDELKKARELEQARKAGTIEPEKDEQGRDINPHIPQYISKAPWYLDSGVPTLKHQRNEKLHQTRGDIDKWYERGKRLETKKRKFQKGCCENCGAGTHKTKDCMERPRKVGAKWTGKDLQPDETIQDIDLSWEGKHDRWNGFNPAEYKHIIEYHESLEKERQRLKAEQIEKELTQKTRKEKDSDDDDLSEFSESDNDEGFKQKASGDVIIQQKDEGTRVTVRNLRIREDTAKYLRNLDVNSAYYDPKSRSMRADPLPHIDPDDKDFAGDNFILYSGDTQKIAQVQLNFMEAERQGLEMPHLIAEPSLAELVHREYKTKKESVEEKHRREVLEKYGGEEYLRKPSDELNPQQSELYIEYGPDGRIRKGLEKSIPRSKYAEDVHEGNHSSVWGSFYKNGRWGYKCCHQTVRRSYCTGTAGRDAEHTSEAIMMAATERYYENRLQEDCTQYFKKNSEKVSESQGSMNDNMKNANLESHFRKEGTKSINKS